MGQVLFHKRVEENTKVRSIRHVSDDKDSCALISQGWELIHVEHDSGCLWNHYMLMWTKEENPPEFKTEYEKRQEEQKATEEVSRQQVTREKLLVEVLVKLIPSRKRRSKEAEILIEQIASQAKYAYDKELYPHALKLLQS